MNSKGTYCFNKFCAKLHTKDQAIGLSECILYISHALMDVQQSNCVLILTRFSAHTVSHSTQLHVYITRYRGTPSLA